MSYHRDDDEAARQRIEALESELHQREAEVAAQRAALARKEAELSHLRSERASGPDPYEASPYAVPDRPLYNPQASEPSPYAPPDPQAELPPQAWPPQGGPVPAARAPLTVLFGLVSAGMSHVVSVFGFFLGFASCLDSTQSCDAAKAEGHATFVDAGWTGLLTALLAIVLGALSLRQISRLGAGYRRGVLSIVFGATGTLASVVLFLLAAMSSESLSKNPSADPWWMPKRLPDHWFR